MHESTLSQPPAQPARRAQETIRLGAVSYLNTLPLIEGLGKLRDVSLTLTAPSLLIDLLLAREIDLGLVSLIDAQRSPEPLAMVPAGIIGCDGPTMTVRLFATQPVETLTRIWVDADSHTSVALLRVVLAERYGLRPEIIEFDVDAHRDEPWPEALLVIGDKVVTDSPVETRYTHQLDLGEQWKQITGLPFVYAIWMCRAVDADSPLVRTARAILDRQRRRNAARLDWIVETRAPLRGWSEDLARHYLGSLLRYDLTIAHRESIERFFDLCATHGVIDGRRPTLWV